MCLGFWVGQQCLIMGFDEAGTPHLTDITNWPGLPNSCTEDIPKETVPLCENLPPGASQVADGRPFSCRSGEPAGAPVRTYPPLQEGARARVGS